LLGLWIPNFYYWGLNQYITQRTLGSASLSQGQKGIVFAAYLKLLIPFVVVIPGIIAFNVFHRQMQIRASDDAGVAMALYLKANPQTQLVRTVEEPDESTVAAHAGPTYLLALFDSDSAASAVRGDYPFVLPLTRSVYERLQPAKFQTFSDREDRAWRHVNPELAREIEAFNKRISDEAEAAGETPTSQALVAYKYDTALGLLLGMLPQNKGVFGFVMAALLGAVISSLAAMLNAASSIFTLDLLQKYIAPNSSQAFIVLAGRVAVVTFAVIACAVAPLLGDPNISNSIFTIIQESQGLISPGILAVFVLGLILRRCPRWAGVLGLATSIVCYAALKFVAPELQFLNRMAIVFGMCIGAMVLAWLSAPLKEPVEFHARTELDLTSSKGALIAGMISILITLTLYVIFSPLVVAR
jgi:SSS family solute:Na+ symporter